MGKVRDPIISVMKYLRYRNRLSDLKIDPYYRVLLSEFSKVQDQDKLDILEELEADQSLVVAYLGYLEAEKLYHYGDRNRARDLLEWMEDNFSKHQEIKHLIENFDFRIESLSKINSRAIGILLPLSGSKKNFGMRALQGIDSAFRKNQSKTHLSNLCSRLPRFGGNWSAGIKRIGDPEACERGDWRPFCQRGETRIRGGRQQGVFFVSLGQVYLPKEKKNNLLLEIPASVESIVSALFGQQHLEQFGSKTAIIYPRTDRGEAFANEFWRRASLQREVKVTDVIGYQARAEKTPDYRDPVKRLLGLKYIRERQEEYRFLEEVYALEKNRSVRRVQILKPKVDFDWVFVPAFPLEAIQIIPSFKYFDAFNTFIIGDASWRSNRLLRESRKFKNIHFVGDDASTMPHNFVQQFYKGYGRHMGLIETMAFDAFYVVDALNRERDFRTRSELINYLRDLDRFASAKGLGHWEQLDGLWMKKMVMLHLNKGKITRSNLLSAEEKN